LYESELSAFLAFRSNAFLNHSLGHFSQNQLEISNIQGEIRTYNILLEHAAYDLQAVFTGFKPLTRSSEITSFWAGMLDIGEAIAAIHNFSRARDGRQELYHGYVRQKTMLLKSPLVSLLQVARRCKTFEYTIRRATFHVSGYWLRTL
jgi:hypothetical protein